VVRVALLTCFVLGCGGGDGAGPDAAPAGDGTGGAFPLTEAQIIHACVLFASCLEDGGVNRCFRDLNTSALSPDELLCLAAADGCARARACVGASLTPDPACTDPPACTGEVLTGCAGGRRYQLDCAFYEGGTCAAAPVPGCFCAEFGRCDGDRRIGCYGGRDSFLTIDCGLLGQTCVEAGGSADCVDGTSLACDVLASPRQWCEGADLVVCQSPGMTERIDCSRAISGWSCQDVPGRGPQCGWAADCAYDDLDETCNGSLLTACVGGRLQTIDCADHGFATCEPTSQGKAWCL